MIKRVLAMLFSALLALGLTACGNSSESKQPRNPSATAPNGHTKPDRDNDGDNNDDDAHVLYYGHAPSATERGRLVALVSSYYRAAANEDGAKACALLMPFIAESATENLGHQQALRGKTCATVMTKLFTLHHRLITGESATLKFYTVRVNGGKALTVLSFANLPEVRQLTERRDTSGAWRVLDLSDGILE